jgi:hypothetical protein
MTPSCTASRGAEAKGTQEVKPVGFNFPRPHRCRGYSAGTAKKMPQQPNYMCTSATCTGSPVIKVGAPAAKAAWL